MRVVKAILTTIMTEGCNRPHLLLTSSHRLGVGIHVTQASRLWENFFFNKIKYFKDDVERMDCDVILYADVRDCFLTSKNSVERSVSVLEACGKGVLVSGETNCFPWPEKHARLLNDGVSKFPYPNSGAFVARKDALLDVLGYMLRKEASGEWDNYEENDWHKSNCDQQYWCEAVLDGLVAVNKDGDWCLNIYGLTEDEIGSISSRPKDQWPALIHGSSSEYKGHAVDSYRRMVN